MGRDAGGHTAVVIRNRKEQGPAVSHVTLRFSRRWLRRMASSGMIRRVALVKTDVSEELSASIIKATRIG
jgi:hypothetical protein